MLLESGVGWISPHLLDHPKTLWKTKKILFDFLKVHNELGKVTKFWTSKPLFSRRNGRLKKVRADSAPPALIGLKLKKLSMPINNFWFNFYLISVSSFIFCSLLEWGKYMGIPKNVYNWYCWYCTKFTWNLFLFLIMYVSADNPVLYMKIIWVPKKDHVCEL